MINIAIKSKDINKSELIKGENYNIILNYNDKEIIDLIINAKINILVIDFVFPSLEFILSIKMLKNYNSNLKIIIAIDIVEESLIRLLYDNGVDYILVRPLDLKSLIPFFDKIIIDNLNNQMVNKETSDSIFTKKLIKVLNTLGMPANLKGYSYIKEAIKLCFKDNKYYLHTTSCLYPILANKFNTPESCIEKAIRGAIELCWYRGNIKEQEKIFGYTVDKNKGRPTNGEFLAQLFNYLQTF